MHNNARLSSHRVESLSEIRNGDAPVTPGGCIAQAWTVGLKEKSKNPDSNLLFGSFYVKFPHT